MLSTSGRDNKSAPPVPVFFVALVEPPSPLLRPSRAHLHCCAVEVARSVYCCAVEVAHSVNCCAFEVARSVYCRAAKVARSVYCRAFAAARSVIAAPSRLRTLIQVAPSRSHAQFIVAPSRSRAQFIITPSRPRAQFIAAPSRFVSVAPSQCAPSSSSRRCGCALKFIVTLSRSRAQLIVAHPPSSLHPSRSYLHCRARHHASILIIMPSCSFLRLLWDHLLALSCAQLHCAIMCSTSSLHWAPLRTLSIDLCEF